MGKEFEIRRSSTDRSFFFWSPLSKMAIPMTMERQKQRAISYAELMKQVKAAAPPLPRPSSSSWGGAAKQACICAPTSHPGSFKCRLHRIQQSQKPSVPSSGVQAVCVVPLRSLKRDKVARRCMPPASTKGIRRGASRLSKVETLSQTPAAKVTEAEPPQDALATGTESVPAVHQP
ncbi:uncharacterized protein LOC116251377 [Nymphaea colorata]|nr:uncharacterized protein LOC116251377 [Nymphaea colorata]